MKGKVVILVAMCLAVVPGVVVAASPSATSHQDTAVAYFDSPDGSSCVILTLAEGMYRPTGSEAWSYGQAIDLQLAGSGCSPTVATGSASLSADQYRIFALTGAYASVDDVAVGTASISVDIAWIATGSPKYASERHEEWSFVGREAAAHLTGTVVVDGVPYVPQQWSAILRSFSISKNF